MSRPGRRTFPDAECAVRWMYEVLGNMRDDHEEEAFQAIVKAVDRAYRWHRLPLRQVRMIQTLNQSRASARTPAGDRLLREGLEAITPGLVRMGVVVPGQIGNLG